MKQGPSPFFSAVIFSSFAPLPSGAFSAQFKLADYRRGGAGAEQPRVGPALNVERMLEARASGVRFCLLYLYVSEYAHKIRSLQISCAQ